MVYPRNPETFWNFNYALKFISKKAAFPPLGLLTVASLLPDSWEKKLVDMNVGALKDEDIKWADYVFISAMEVQRKSTLEVIARCNRLGARIVAGGPMFTISYDDFQGVDCFALGEGESTVPQIVADIHAGAVQRIYRATEMPDIKKTPLPSWNLVNIKKYAVMSVQYSRGCPFNCEFCDIATLNGRVPRSKGVDQFLRELDAIHKMGWRNTVFVVDDNFVGNRKKLKQETLPAVIGWMEERKHPVTLFTQASIDLADDEHLMRMMAKAGFDTVFVGIETPNEDSLNECNKRHNATRDLVASVERMHAHGLRVHGGFIVGFDSDPSSIFDQQISFIQRTGIVSAMVGMLTAPRGTPLYQRLKKEDRLVKEWSGDNTDMSLNFVPRMGQERLVSGYKRILANIYSPAQYYARIGTFLKMHRPELKGRLHLKVEEFLPLIKSMWYLGVRERGRKYYWRLVSYTLLRKPRSFRMALTLAIWGYHFRKFAEKYTRTPATVKSS